MIQEVKNIFYNFIPVLDSREKKIAAGAAVVTGIAAVCFALYYAGSNIPSFTRHSPASDKEADKLFPPASCEDRLKEGKELFFSCPAAKAHWEEVERAGKIRLRCTPHVLVQSGGEADSFTRTISISDQIGSDRITDTLLFESCNLKYPFKPARKFVCSKTPDEYAQWVERTEHRTVIDTQAISSQCIREGYWPDRINVNNAHFTPPYEGGNWNNFEEYLKSQEEAFHTDVYRFQWYRSCDPKGLQAWADANAEKWHKAAPKNKEEL